MKLFLSSEREFLPVVDACSLIAKHFMDRDEQPVLVDGDVWQLVQSDSNNRPAPNIALVIKERLWVARLRAGALNGKLNLYGGDGDNIQFHDETFVCAYVKLADLAQWLVDEYKKVVVLNGVQVAPTPAPAHVEPEILKKKALMARYESIWPSLVADVQEGSRNRLKATAGVKRGYYDVQRALRWARENNKLVTPGLQTQTPLNDLPNEDDRKPIKGYPKPDNGDWLVSEEDHWRTL